jgi:hypothetical protein
VLAMAFISGIEIELFEAHQKDFTLLESFRDELIGYFSDYLVIKKALVTRTWTNIHFFKIKIYLPFSPLTMVSVYIR